MLQVLSLIYTINIFDYFQKYTVALLVVAIVRMADRRVISWQGHGKSLVVTRQIELIRRRAEGSVPKKR